MKIVVKIYIVVVGEAVVGEAVVVEAAVAQAPDFVVVVVIVDFDCKIVVAVAVAVAADTVAVVAAVVIGVVVDLMKAQEKTNDDQSMETEEAVDTSNAADFAAVPVVEWAAFVVTENPSFYS